MTKLMDKENDELQTFLMLIEQGVLKEVSHEVYSDIIKEHIKRFNIPCETSLNVFHMRKRIGAAYVELKENAPSVDSNVGLQEQYRKKYDDFACYGWLELAPGEKQFFINPGIYPTWLKANVLKFP